MNDETRTPPPDWYARAFACLDVYARAYAAWMRQVQPILDDLAVQLARVCDDLAVRLARICDVQQSTPTTSVRRVRRSYRRDLHRAYRRRYHQRPPLRRASR